LHPKARLPGNTRVILQRFPGVKRPVVGASFGASST